MYHDYKMAKWKKNFKKIKKTILMLCDWNDWIKRRQGVKCLAKNTTWLTCKGPTHTHRGSLQSSKLQPFWLPWQEKNIFGNWNFNKSCQLVTDRFLKKKRKRKCKKFINSCRIIKDEMQTNCFVTSRYMSWPNVFYGNHFTILMVAKVQLFEKLSSEPCIFI